MTDTPIRAKAREAAHESFRRESTFDPGINNIADAVTVAVLQYLIYEYPLLARDLRAKFPPPPERTEP